MTCNYIEGDIHEIITTLEDNSIDFIYTDPPFGTTKASWDKPLRWEELFKEMWRVLKPDGIICLYASIPFTYELLRYEKPKYHYTWIKNNSTGFFQAKYQPLRKNEEIFIYYKSQPVYNPQMIGDKFYPKRKVLEFLLQDLRMLLFQTEVYWTDFYIELIKTNHFHVQMI